MFPTVFEDYTEERKAKLLPDAGIPSTRIFRVEFNLNISDFFSSPHFLDNCSKVSFSILISQVALLLLGNCKPCQGKPIFEKYLPKSLIMNCKAPTEHFKIMNVLFKHPFQNCTWTSASHKIEMWGMH